MSQIDLCKLKELYKEEIIELIDCCGAVLKEVTVSRRCTEVFSAPSLFVKRIIPKPR